MNMSSAGEAYAFDMFETHERSAAHSVQRAPAADNEERVRPVLKKVAPVSREKKLRDEKHTAVRIGFMLSFVAIVFSVICCQISAGAERYELIRQIDEAEAAVEVAKSENIRLNSELNAITGISKIDTYAMEMLGMTKIENYQVEYIDLSGGDSVIYSNAKTGAAQ